MAYYTVAEHTVGSGPLAAPNGLRGRSLAKLVRDVVKIWGLFRGILAVYLPVNIVAALDVLATATGLEVYINPPGPE